MGATMSTATLCVPCARGGVLTTNIGRDTQESLPRMRENSENGTVITYGKVLERMIQLRNFLGAADATEGEGDEA